jgi:O-antigen/teichoic acid export membrane protein
MRHGVRTPQSARANIAWAMTAKLVSMLVAVLSVPLLLQLLGTHVYGTWVTLTSLIAFITLLDLGVGNSMRNSVASMAASDEASVQLEFIGFFRLLCIVALTAMALFGAAEPFLDLPGDQRLGAWLLYGPLLLLLPLLLGGSVLQGARATGLQAVLQSAGGWGFFAFIALMAWLGRSPDLGVLAVAWSFCNVLALSVMFVFALRTLRVPVKRLLQGSLASLPKGRLRVGLEFLVLQLSSLVLYSLGNILVFRHLGANEVARYDVVNKIFQVGLSLYTIVIGVMWSEIAKFRATGDGSALTRTWRRLAAVATLFSMASVIGAFGMPTLVEVWTRHRIQVTSGEALAVAALVSIQALSYVGAVFMNAFEQIRLQILLAIVSITMMIPLTTFFLSRGWGIVSVPLAAMMLTLLPMLVCNLSAVWLIRGVRRSKAASA